MVRTLYILIACINWVAALHKKNCSCISIERKFCTDTLLFFCEDGQGWHSELNDPSGLASCLLCFPRRHAHHIMKQNGDVAAMWVTFKRIIYNSIWWYIWYSIYLICLNLSRRANHIMKLMIYKEQNEEIGLAKSGGKVKNGQKRSATESRFILSDKIYGAYLRRTKCLCAPLMDYFLLPLMFFPFASFHS